MTAQSMAAEPISADTWFYTRGNVWHIIFRSNSDSGGVAPRVRPQVVFTYQASAAGTLRRISGEPTCSKTSRARGGTERPRNLDEEDGWTAWYSWVVMPPTKSPAGNGCPRLLYLFLYSRCLR